MKKLLCGFMVAILLFCNACSNERDCYSIAIEDDQWYVIITEEQEAYIRDMAKKIMEGYEFTIHINGLNYVSVADVQKAFSEKKLSIADLFELVSMFPRDEQGRIPIYNMDALYTATQPVGVTVFKEKSCGFYGSDYYSVTYDLGEQGKAHYVIGKLPQTETKEYWMNWIPEVPYIEERDEETGVEKFVYEYDDAYGKLAVYRFRLESEERNMLIIMCYSIEEQDVNVSMKPLSVSAYAAQNGVEYSVQWKELSEMPSKETLLSLGIEPFVPEDAA